MRGDALATPGSCHLALPVFRLGPYETEHCVRLGVDVGGTFTDAVLVDPESGEVSVTKVATTGVEVAQGTLEAASQAVGRLERLETLIHGTTLVTNALIERRTAPVGLLATAGFRDVLEIRRTRRRELYDLAWPKPANLVKRRHRCEIRERIGRDGAVVTPIELDDVRVAAQALRAAGIVDRRRSCAHG